MSATAIITLTGFFYFSKAPASWQLQKRALCIFTGVILWMVTGLSSIFPGDTVLGYWQHLGLVCCRYWIEPSTRLLLILMSCVIFFWAIFTTDSTFLLALLWCGHMIVCSMPHLLVEDFNLLDVNWGLLSVTSCLGIPSCAMCDFNFFITVNDLVLVSESTSKKLDL